MRLERNPSFEAQQKREVTFHAAIEANADKVLALAQGIAPVGAHLGDHYRDTLKTKRVGGNVYVTTTDFAGHMVEWGSKNNVAYAPIRRAVRASGLRLDESPRTRINQPGFTAVIRGV